MLRHGHAQVSTSQQGLADSVAFEEELASSKGAARAAALEDATGEAKAWAEGQKGTLRQQALDTATKQVRVRQGCVGWAAVQYPALVGACMHKVW